jgi:2-haloacid dehalogenase
MKYEWLLFDADGTLFDYQRAEAKALEGAFGDFSLPFDDRSAQAYRTINHQVWVDFENGRITSTALRVVRFERLFAHLGVDTDAGQFSDRYLFHLAAGSDLISGAEEVIGVLKNRCRLGLITNGLKDVQRPRLARSAIATCFDVLAISEELGVAKPDPRYFDEVFARMGQPARESVLVIGDSLTSDILGGLNYGVDTCWYNPAGLPPNPEIPATFEIRQLTNLLDRLDPFS